MMGQTESPYIDSIMNDEELSHCFIEEFILYLENVLKEQIVVGGNSDMQR